MRTVRIGVSGSRTITDKDFVFQQLDFYLSRLLKDNECIIVHGGAKGFDSLCELWAQEKGIKTEIYLPDYKNNNPKVAPILRNQTIVDNSDYFIAMQQYNSRGTQNAINKAIKRGLPIKIITI
jgi:hypothetical protein